MNQKVMFGSTRYGKSLIIGQKETRKRNSNNPMTQQEIVELIENTTDLTDKTLFIIGANTGMRVSEIVALTRLSIKREEQIITIWDKKKDRYRDVIVPNTVFKHIELYLNTLSGKNNDRLFDFSKKTLQRKVQRWTIQLLGKKKSWHSIRHTYVTLSALLDVPISIVCENTGDSAETILKVYQNIPPQEKRRIVNERAIYGI